MFGRVGMLIVACAGVEGGELQRQQPGVMMLIDSPIRLNTRMVTSRNAGIAISDIAVTRQLPGKSGGTTATIAEGAGNLPFRLPVELSLNDAWRHVMRSFTWRPMCWCLSTQ